MVKMMFESWAVSKSRGPAPSAFESKLSQIWLRLARQLQDAGSALSVTFLHGFTEYTRVAAIAVITD